MRSYRCNPALAKALREVSTKLDINESALIRLAVSVGIKEIISKHVNAGEQRY